MRLKVMQPTYMHVSVGIICAVGDEYFVKVSVVPVIKHNNTKHSSKLLPAAVCSSFVFD